MTLPVRQVADPGAQQNWEYLGARVIWGKGSPEGVVRATVGALYLDENGGAGATLYVKESGAGTDTGWAAK